jgi:hypothetical protein
MGNLNFLDLETLKNYTYTHKVPSRPYKLVHRHSKDSSRKYEVEMCSAYACGLVDIDICWISNRIV